MMFTISLKESVTIGIITALCAIFIQVIVKTFGEEDVQKNNLFYKHKNSCKFYISLFVIGILLHVFIKYIEFDEWYCEKICTNDVCKVLCTLPLNGFTNLLITI